MVFPLYTASHLLMQPLPEQGMKKLRAETQLTSHGLAWLVLPSVADKNCPLPFPQRKTTALKPSAVSQSCTRSLEAAFHPTSGWLPWGAAAQGPFRKAHAMAISAVPRAASADNEKPFCLTAIKLLPFHERNPEFFLKPKQKSEPLFVSSLSRAATFKWFSSSPFISECTRWEGIGSLLIKNKRWWHYNQCRVVIITVYLHFHRALALGCLWYKAAVLCALIEWNYFINTHSLNPRKDPFRGEDMGRVVGRWGARWAQFLADQFCLWERFLCSLQNCLSSTSGYHGVFFLQVKWMIWPPTFNPVIFCCWPGLQVTYGHL